MTDHPYADFAAYAATLAPGETVTYHFGPSLACVAEIDPDLARIREGYLALGSPTDQHIRPLHDSMTDGSAGAPPYGLGMGFLTQKKMRGRDGEATRFAYRFTRARGADEDAGATEAAASAGDTVRPAELPDDGGLQASG